MQSKRVAAAMPQIERMLAAGMPILAIAKRTGVSDVTVYAARARLATKSTVRSAAGLAPESSATKSTYRDTLDAAWHRGREFARSEMRRWIASGADLDDIDAAPRAPCGCLASDLQRSPCPGHLEV